MLDFIGGFDMMSASSRFGGFGVFTPKTSHISFLRQVCRKPASRFGCKPETSNLLDTVGESDAGFVLLNLPFRLAKLISSEVLSMIPKRPDFSKTANQIHERCGWRCWYCGVEVVRYTRRTKLRKDQRKACIDHQQPIAQGGTDDPDNLVSCCASCNSQKIGRNLEEFRVYMAFYSGQRLKEVKARFRIAESAKAFDEPIRSEILAMVKRIDSTMKPYVFYGEMKH